MIILKDNWFSDFLYDLGFFKKKIEASRFKSRYDSTRSVLNFIYWLGTPEGVEAMKNALPTGHLINISEQPSSKDEYPNPKVP